MKLTRNKAILLLIFTAILWSSGGLFIKLIDWSPLSIAGGRSGISAIVLLLYIRRPLAKLNKTIIFGTLSYALLVFLFVSANKITTSANAILLQFTAPVWVLLISWIFLKEKIQKIDILTTGAVLFGMALFFMGNLKPGGLLGNVFGILSGVAMASMVIFLKRAQGKEALDVIILGNIVCFVCGLPFLLQEHPTSSSLEGIAFLGVIQLGISYIFYVTAIKHVSALEALLIPVLEPLLNPVWVFVFTGERPSSFALLGGAIVIATILAWSIHKNAVYQASKEEMALVSPSPTITPNSGS
jgi:drug/metabolite transporter (DMT)-like permease